MTVLEWLLTASLTWVPAPTTPPWGETASIYAARREAIVADAFAVANDPTEAPLFVGAHSRERTALFMLAIASYESGYDFQVDTGKRLGKIGEACIMQILVMGKSAEGWTRNEIISDRKKCFRAALHGLRASAAACKPMGYTGADLYSVYASGKCSLSKAMRLRWTRATGYWALHPFTETP